MEGGIPTGIELRFMLMNLTAIITGFYSGKNMKSRGSG